MNSGQIYLVLDQLHQKIIAFEGTILRCRRCWGEDRGRHLGCGISILRVGPFTLFSTGAHSCICLTFRICARRQESGLRFWSLWWHAYRWKSGTSHWSSTLRWCCPSPEFPWWKHAKPCVDVLVKLHAQCQQVTSLLNWTSHHRQSIQAVVSWGSKLHNRTQHCISCRHDLQSKRHLLHSFLAWLIIRWRLVCSLKICTLGKAP